MSKKVFSRKYLKLITIDSIVKATNNSSCKNKLLVHTSNGIYIGNLRNQVEYDNTEIEENDDTLTCFNKLYLSSLEKYEADKKSKEIPEISENFVTIELEDVQLVNGASRVNMPFVELFVDQIIGFSIGSLDE